MASSSAWAQIPTFAAADLVLGRGDFVSNALTSAAATTLQSPRAVAVDPATGKVFVADSLFHRVLRYGSEASLANGAAAEAVFGQVDFTSDDINSGAGFGNPTRRSLSAPAGLMIDLSGRLWVADFNNSRVLMWENASGLSSNAEADLVLGQGGFTVHSPDAGANRMRTPQGVWADGSGNLWVADSGNSRVLRFANAAALANGASASQVIGQANFSGSGGTVGASRMANPFGVMVDAEANLWVADTSNSRILRFENAATRGDGPSADQVVGQSDLTSNSSGSGEFGLHFPSVASVDRFGSLWVCDTENNRILRYDGITSAGDRPAANGVVGQPNFSSGGPGLSDREFALSNSSQLHLSADGDLWIGDSVNDRVLRFSRPAILPKTVDSTNPTLKVRGRKTVETLRKRVVIRGTAADASGIARIEVKVRGAKVVKSKVKGNDSFKVVLRVRKDRGRVVAKLRAVDGVGLKSKQERFRILRR